MTASDEATSTSPHGPYKLLTGIFAGIAAILGTLQGASMIERMPAMPPSPEQIQQLTARIATIAEVVTKTDPDGTPLVYMPREILRVQQSMLDELRQINNSLRVR